VKISDAYVPADCVTVAQVTNCHKTMRGIEPLSIQMFMECMDASPQKPVPFSFAMTINEGIFIKGLRRSITLNELFEACFEFFSDSLDQETFRFYQNSAVASYLENILEKREWSEEETLLRVGRFSHFESMTIKEYRQLQRPRRVRFQRDQERDEPGQLPGTRNLYEAKYPMGWVRLTVAKEEEVHVSE
jgi:hypothetical protein